jgi:diacylglycerol O-acyltransferase-1
MKYGVLICIRCHDYRYSDIKHGAFLLALLPCHLFLAYSIEKAASRWATQEVGQRKKSDEPLVQKWNSWGLVSVAHTLNATLCVCITSTVVYQSIFHPLIGTVCEFLAIIIWLKIISYALTNRDLRLTYLYPSPDDEVPEMYNLCPYPQNITVGNLVYFWWAPTLVYQPVYPRTERIRWTFVLKRLSELAGLSAFIWVLSSQYAAPLLLNSLNKPLSPWNLIERLMKLSTISLVTWLAVFFALFQSFLNAVAEVTTFADREFYTDWWNAPSVGIYWRTWNRPVYQFMKRHLYIPMKTRGYSQTTSSIVVFLFSAFFHELLVGIPTHNLIGVAFMGMIFQIPLIALTAPLEKVQKPALKALGNTIFWVSFCLVGQPLAALLYFFAWQGKYGSGRAAYAAAEA